MRKRTPIILLASGFLLSVAIAGTVQASAPRVREARVSNIAIERITTSELSAPDASASTEATSVTKQADFAFTGAIVSWPLHYGHLEEVLLEVRANDDGAWTSWMPVSALHDAPQRNITPEGRQWSEPMMFVSATALQFRVSGNTEDVDAQLLRDLSVVYIKITQPSPAVSWLKRILPFHANAESSVPVISRAEWGADESYRFNANGSEIWRPSYATIQKFIVHHTAGSNGGSNPKAVIQSIYYFHAVVLGWGDIGYNYLIDPQGRIYEGRFGGDAVTGGHTYNEQEDTDYNRGSIGIALLGNFEGDPFTAASKNSLSSLLGEKGHLFGIKPDDTGYFRGRMMPNIIGHGDVDATTCPGAHIRSALQSVRTQAQSYYDSLGPLPEVHPAAQVVSQSVTEIALRSGTQADVVFSYRNVGNLPWQSYNGQRKITMRPLGEGMLLYSQDWESEEEVGTPDTANVLVGATGVFTVPITAPSEASEVLAEFALFDGQGQELPNTRLTVRVSVTDIAYAATITAESFPSAMFYDGTATVTLRVHNSGTQAWAAGDVYLQAFDLGGRLSLFHHPSWREVTLDAPITSAVQPGQSTTFTIRITAPHRVGEFLNIFRMIRGNGTVLAGELRQITRVDSQFKASIVSHNFPVAILRYWQPAITVRLRNTGIGTWTRAVKLQVYDLGYQESRFVHPSWASVSADVQMAEQEVRPGEIGTFTFRIKPSAIGLFKHVLKLAIPGRSVIIQHDEISTLMRVD